MLSGSALANWSFSSDPVTKSEFFTKQLGCPVKFNVTETIECLQSKSTWSDFVEIDMKMFANDISPIWGPVLDGKILSSDTNTGSPLQRMQSGEYFDYEVTLDEKYQSESLARFSLESIKEKEYSMFLSPRSIHTTNPRTVLTRAGQSF